MPAIPNPVILFLIFLSAQVSSLTKVTGAAAKTDFFDRIDKFTTHLRQKPLESRQDSLLKSYSVRGTFEHIINIGFKIQDVDSYVMSFTGAKTSPVIKITTAYDKEEMELQTPAFGELLRRMTVVTESSKPDLFFNTIADVKQRIVGLSNNPKQKLFFQEDFTDRTVHLKLFCMETLLGLFEATIEAAGVQEFDDGYRQTDYEIIVRFTISYTNQETTEQVRIPVFSDSQKAFEQAVGLITSKLHLFQFVNSNEDNLAQFAAFVKANFKGYGFATDERQNSLDLKRFGLSFDDQSATGSIAYIPPQLGEKVGGYKLEIYKGGEFYSGIVYKRMSHSELKNEFDKLRLESLFESLWERIKRVYKAKFESWLKEVYPSCQWTDSTEKPNLWSNTLLVFTAKCKNGDGMALKYVESKGKVNLIWESDKASLSQMKFKFVKSEYKMPVIERFFDSILKSFSSLLAKTKAV